MMEKLARERGRAAFDRTVFTVEPWSGAVPASDHDIAFLPAHRLAALIKANPKHAAVLKTLSDDDLGAVIAHVIELAGKK